MVGLEEEEEKVVVVVVGFKDHGVVLGLGLGFRL
jgi:hypothetical protein